MQIAPIAAAAPAPDRARLAEARIYLEEASSSASDAYSLTDSLRGGHGSLPPEQQAREAVTYLYNAIQAAEEAEAYVPEGSATMSHLFGAVDALTGATYVYEEGAGTPVERADEAIDLIADGEAELAQAMAALEG